MRIRSFQDTDLPQLIDLTIETFRPLFERHLPEAIGPEVLAHDHGDWENDYRHEVPTLHDPEHDRFVVLAEEEGRILGYVGWNIAPSGSGRLEMVAVHPGARRRGIGNALCREALDGLRDRGVSVVHIGTGGDAFHAPARRLYESLDFRLSRRGLQQGALAPGRVAKATRLRHTSDHAALRAASLPALVAAM